ncbi:interleukin-12 receptor subunit beta-2-like [Hyperolius riggenbachi]|uniref:interleukin-12 receptor subunit beta-2-like n=1 Tax=Hyperolius riggenbachi TaxID=752182 RepID=UPI0035A3BDEF
MEKQAWLYCTAIHVSFLYHLIHSLSVTCPQAVMEVKPSNVVHVGSPVTITCNRTDNKSGINISKAHITKGRNELGKSITIQDTSLTPGEAFYGCNTNERHGRLICVLQVHFGFPPDQPTRLSCEQEGEFGNISCSFLLGRDSGIDTSCTLLLQMGGNSSTESIQSGCTNGIHSLTLPVAVQPGSDYLAWVISKNSLGTNISRWYNFSFYDVVKPQPPTNLTVNCHETSEECWVTVHSDGDLQIIRLRYRASTDRDWLEVDNSDNKSFIIHYLDAATPYLFQTACKYRAESGKWSNWSQSVTIETPERAPQARIKVWYKLQKVMDEKWTIRLYWKILEAKGHIQFFQITFQPLSGSGPASIHNTTTTVFSTDIEAGEYVIAVSAYNSKGNSTPTLAKVTTHDFSAQSLSSPTNLVATTSSPNNSVTLSWESPAGKKGLFQDQIIEWEDPTEQDPSHVNWVDGLWDNRSVTLSGHFKPYVCYVFRIYFLRDGRAGAPATTMAAVQQKAPDTSPDFKNDVQKDNTVLVVWREIPRERQMGCLTHYTIYLQDLTSNLMREIQILHRPSLTHQYEISDLEDGVRYMLWMTCSNEAGESVAGQEAYFTLDGTQEGFYTVLSVIISICIFPFLLLLILVINEGLLKLSSGILQKWCMKTVPDPANCEWAKEFISTKERLRSFPSYPSSTSDCDEAETLEIELVSSEEEFHYCPTYTINTVQTIVADIPHQVESEDLMPTMTLHHPEETQYRSLAIHPGGGITEQTTDYLVNHVITMDYLQRNTVNKCEREIEEDQLQPQLFLTSLAKTSATLRLDTVRLDFS